LRPGLRWVPALEAAIGRSKAATVVIVRHGIGKTQQTGTTKICECATSHSTGTVQVAIARRRTAQVAVVALVIALLVAAAAVWQYFKATDATRLAEQAAAQAQTSTERAKANLRKAQTAQEAADNAKKTP
jgi:hypothetical protein